MADLVPIGSTTRAPSENNPLSSPENVQETARSKALDDQNRSMVIDRRRSGDRRARGRDRRSLRQAARAKALRDRRKVMDRRNAAKRKPRDNSDNAQDAKKSPLARKGRIIDERV